MTTEENCLHHDSHSLAKDPSRAAWAGNRRKSLIVLNITLVMMVIEIYFGYITGSMALLADGWHMATHAAALGITYMAYILASSTRVVRNFNFGGGKILFLGGFASSLLLFFVAASVIWESVHRLLNPQNIAFNEALMVAILGLVINLICAWILRDQHTHDHGHGHDHSHGHNHLHHQDINIRGAFLHVLADALTSVGAIIALLMAKYWGFIKMDPIIGIVGALVIIKWAWSLFRDSSWELLDGRAHGLSYDELSQRLQSRGGKIIDLHVWRVAPSSLNCELIIESPQPLGVRHYRQIIEQEFKIQHSVIEERVPANPSPKSN